MLLTAKCEYFFGVFFFRRCQTPTTLSREIWGCLFCFLSKPFDRWANDNEDFVEKLKSSSTFSEEMVVSRTITVNSQSSECEVPWDYDILEVLGQGSAGKVLRARQDA